MRIFWFADLVTQPWKNSGGITREVLRHEAHGQMIFRLSIADVASEGPFSAFPGLQRILTVIDGDGMTLFRADGTTLEANLLNPVIFSGDEPLIGKLPHGRCRDFNVIWNPDCADASVRLIHADEVPFAKEADELVFMLCVSEDARLSTNDLLGKGDCVRLGSDPVALREGDALLVRIRLASQP